MTLGSGAFQRPSSHNRDGTCATSGPHLRRQTGSWLWVATSSRNLGLIGSDAALAPILGQCLARSARILTGPPSGFWSDGSASASDGCPSTFATFSDACGMCRPGHFSNSRGTWLLSNQSPAHWLKNTSADGAMIGLVNGIAIDLLHMADSSRCEWICFQCRRNPWLDLTG